MLQELIIEPGLKTPSIRCLPGGTVVLEGKSIPENAVAFYQPVYEWLARYVQQPAAETTVEVRLEYFNTSSSKCLLDVFRKLEPLHQSGRSAVTVRWHYEEADEDMMEAGDDYRTIVKLGFELVKIS
jgi:hypothetical protein